MMVNSRARTGQAPSHAIASLARCRACVSLSRAMPSRSRDGSDGSGFTPFNKISDFAGKSAYHNGGSEASVLIRYPTLGNTHNTKA
jgi:hypothetical protein